MAPDTTYQWLLHMITINVNPGLINPKRLWKKGGYHKKVLDEFRWNDYWRSTPLIFINHGLAKSGVDILRIISDGRYGAVSKVRAVRRIQGFSEGRHLFLEKGRDFLGLFCVDSTEGFNHGLLGMSMDFSGTDWELMRNSMGISMDFTHMSSVCSGGLRFSVSEHADSMKLHPNGLQWMWKMARLIGAQPWITMDHCLRGIQRFFQNQLPRHGEPASQSSLEKVVKKQSGGDRMKK